MRNKCVYMNLYDNQMLLSGAEGMNPSFGSLLCTYYYCKVSTFTLFHGRSHNWPVELASPLEIQSHKNTNKTKRNKTKHFWQEDVRALYRLHSNCGSGMDPAASGCWKRFQRKAIRTACAVWPCSPGSSSGLIRSSKAPLMLFKWGKLRAEVKPVLLRE